MKARNALVRVAMVGTIGILGLIAAACGSSDSTKAIDLVPAQSNALGSIDLAQVLSDADVQAGYEMIAAANDDAPATFEELLALGVEEVGVDLKGFQEIVFFGELEGADADFAGVMASGSPPQEEIFEALLAVEGNDLVTAEYGGQSLLLSGEDESATTVLGGVLVLGSVNAVHAVVDVFNGDADALEGDLLDAYDELGDVWVKVVLDVPAGATDDLMGDGGDIGLPIDLGGILDIERVTVVADRNGEDGVLAVTLVYATDEEAANTAETLDALLTLASSFSDDPQLDSLTEMLSITSTEESVELEIRQTIQEILDSLEGVLEGDGSLISSFS